MSIELTLDSQEFAALVEQNRFSRFTLTGIESVAGHYTVVGKLRRPMNGAQWLGVYSQRHDVRPFKTLEYLARYCRDELGIEKVEIDLDEITKQIS